MSSSDELRLLHASDFVFYGFDHLQSEVEATFDDVGIRRGPLQFNAAQDVIFVPSTKLPAAYKGSVRTAHAGSLLTSEGRPVEYAQARRRTLRWGPIVRGEVFDEVVAQAVAIPDRVLDEEVVYLGWLFEHFGHFLTESLSRTWFLRQCDPSTKVVFHRKREFTPSATIARILELFDIPLERVIFLDEPTLLRRVIVPEPTYELHWTIHEETAVGFRRAAEQIVDKEDPSSQPVYLSRRLLPSHLRQIVGEFELEEIMRENGFLIAYPETMSFADQVRLINRHDHIFTNAGSAAYNLLFALHQPTAHFLTSGIPRQDYFLLPTVIGASGAYCNGLIGMGRDFTKTLPVLADFPTFVGYLESQGFLRKRLRSTLAIQATKPRDSFPEAWLCNVINEIRPAADLPEDVEQEGLALAPRSWLLSLFLAKYYSSRNPSRVEPLIRQFTDVVRTETDFEKMAGYYNLVEQTAAQILRSNKDLAEDAESDLLTALTEKFGIDIMGDSGGA